MQWRCNLAHFILAGVIIFGLTLLTTVDDVQGQIAFVSEREGNLEIYVMDADGGNQRRLTKHGSFDGSPAWYAPALAVSPAGRTLTKWGWLKQFDR